MPLSTVKLQAISGSRLICVIRAVEIIAGPRHAPRPSELALADHTVCNPAADSSATSAPPNSIPTWIRGISSAVHAQSGACTGGRWTARRSPRIPAAGNRRGCDSLSQSRIPPRRTADSSSVCDGHPSGCGSTMSHEDVGLRSICQVLAAIFFSISRAGQEYSSGHFEWCGLVSTARAPSNSPMPRWDYLRLTLRPASRGRVRDLTAFQPRPPPRQASQASVDDDEILRAIVFGEPPGSSANDLPRPNKRRPDRPSALACARSTVTWQASSIDIYDLRRASQSKRKDGSLHL